MINDSFVSSDISFNYTDDTNDVFQITTTHNGSESTSTTDNNLSETLMNFQDI